MDKKLVKAIIDITKGVSDRPACCGVEVRKGEKTYIYTTDGYVIVRLECGEYDGLRDLGEDKWIDLNQLKSAYAIMKAKDVKLDWQDDGLDNRANLVNLWGDLDKEQENLDSATINPAVFKKLEPFGAMKMTIKPRGGGKVVKFEGKGVAAFAMPLAEK